MNGYLEDASGNHSSKRLAAYIILIPTLVLGMGVGIASIFMPVRDASSIIKIIETFMFSVDALLAVGVVENWRKKDDT